MRYASAAAAPHAANMPPRHHFAMLRRHAAFITINTPHRVTDDIASKDMRALLLRCAKTISVQAERAVMAQSRPLLIHCRPERSVRARRCVAARVRMRERSA